MLVEKKKQYSDEINTEEASSILWIMSDLYCRAILRNILYTPKSCMEISIECKIPISTVYRRVQYLQDQKLIRINGAISNDGKKYFLYKSKIKSMHASFDGKLDLNITYN